MNRTEYIGKLNALYVGDKNCLEELITAYDEKNKEIERLNNIINELERYLKRLNNIINELERYLEKTIIDGGTRGSMTFWYRQIYDYLQKLKHKKIYGSVDSEIVYFDELGSEKE